MIRYITYHNKNFDVFKSWREAKDFIDKHDGCRYQKAHSNKEEQEFRKKWEGKDDYTKKIYIAINNNTIKRFETWKDCKRYIDTHKSAKYRSFPNEETAQKFINQNFRKIPSITVSDITFCYLGSYSAKGEKPRFSFVAVKNGYAIKEVAGCLKKTSEVGPLGAEIEACIKAIEWGLGAGEERLIIVYSNLAIEMLANGSWQSHKKATTEYVEKIQEMRKGVNIDFLISIQLLINHKPNLSIKE